MILGIFSAKGGVGKTTAAINIAFALRELGWYTLVIDTDINSPNLGMYLGEYNPKITINDVLEGKADINLAVKRHFTGIDFIPARLSSHTTKKDRIDDVIGQLKDYEVIILDPEPHNGFIEGVKKVDNYIIITTPDMTSVTDALRSVNLARKHGKKIMGVLINNKGQPYELTKENIEAMLGTRVIGEVPADQNQALATKVNSPITISHPDSDASKEFRNISMKIAKSI
ncbi:MAG: P-loop NTPase [Nanobdellota archaeon]